MASWHDGGQTERELGRREAILDAVRFGAERFLGASSWEESMGEVLARLGEAAEVSRVYVFENHVGDDGTLWNRQRHKWQVPGVPPNTADPTRRDARDGLRLLGDGSGRWKDFGRWEEVLGRVESLYGNIRDFPDTERQTLGDSFGIRSMVLMPIFVEEEWWGFIGFDDCFAERDWTRAEIDALKAAASTLGAAIRRQRTEESLRRLNEELEQRVGRRTAQLEATNRELEAFSYSVSHDLRAPLRAIDGFSRILQEDYGGALNGDGVGHLARVRAAGLHMTALIDGLLELSQLTRGELRLQTVDLSALAREISIELQASDPDRKVKFVVQEGVTAEGDRRLLEIALDNLLRNAFKFTSGRPKATIEFGRQGGGGATVYYVRDDGVGFDGAQADRLFGAFQRLHGEEEFEGTGIGLSTVQRIVSRHGGRVWAEGEADKGATFYFTL